MWTAVVVLAVLSMLASVAMTGYGALVLAVQGHISVDRGDGRRSHAAFGRRLLPERYVPRDD